MTLDLNGICLDPSCDAFTHSTPHKWQKGGAIRGLATIDAQLFNGLCECLGPLNRHPLHSRPLPAEYVGKHRAP